MGPDVVLSQTIFDALPADFERIAVKKFDALLSQNELYYEPPQIEIAEQDGWQLQFNITTSLSRKPVLAASDPGRSKPVGPFIDPPEEWIVARIGNSHKIILNKYCVYRPMLILHTSDFRRQTEDLDEVDLAAAWAVLHRCQTDQIIIYNCGVDAGSSQGHKHLQIYPRPEQPGFYMWPDKATSTEDIISDIPNIPFKHFVLRLPLNSTCADLWRQYNKLLTATRSALADAPGSLTDYNVIIVREWICLIPRSSKGIDGFVANAANMVGSFWIRSEGVMQWLLGLRVKDVLLGLALPND